MVTPGKQELPNGAFRDNAGKVRYDLLPYDALHEITLVFTYGALKYDDDNWRKGLGWRATIGSCMRHLTSWMRGENTDPETGLSHLAHAAANCMMLIEYQMHNAGKDTRWKWNNEN